MRELKDFNTEKSIYIGKVLNHIHYKKLHTRIYEEISAHLDDMYEDYSSTYDDEKEIVKRVFEEMGHPHYLGLELKKANKNILFWAKAFKIACAVLTLPIIYLSIVAVSLVGGEISDFSHTHTVKEAEQWIVENRADGKPIKLLTEVEHNGVVHRIYIPETQGEHFNIYHIHSTKLFGADIKDRFERSTGSFHSTDTYTIADLEESFGLSDVLLIYFNKPEEKYLKVEYISHEDNSRGTWSDFIEIPQDGTIENPKCVLFDCPDGYRWSAYKRFDENKELIEWE